MQFYRFFTGYVHMCRIPIETFAVLYSFLTSVFLFRFLFVLSVLLFLFLFLFIFYFLFFFSFGRIPSIHSIFYCERRKHLDYDSCIVDDLWMDILIF